MIDGSTVTDSLSEALRGRRLVDLTVTIAEDRPCSWPTHMPFQAKTFSWFADRPDENAPLFNRSGAAYQTRWLLIDEHTGTHVDAPNHFTPPPDSGLANAGPLAEESTDLIPLEELIGPAAVVDITDLSQQGEIGRSPRIEAERLAAWEEEHGPFHSDEVVLLHSGWDRHYRSGSAGSAYAYEPLVERSRHGWPSPTGEAVDYLVERGIRCLGTDGVSIGAVDDGEPAHVAGLSKGMRFVEALCNLDTLPPRGAFFVFLPIKVSGGTGGPGRAIAFLPPSSSA